MCIGGQSPCLFEGGGYIGTFRLSACNRRQAIPPLFAATHFSDDAKRECAAVLGGIGSVVGNGG